MNVRTINIDASSEDVKAKMSSIKTQLNLANMFIKLPEVIMEAEKQIEEKEKMKARMRAAQEGGSI
jgi:peptidoglycan hydrolase CwlO-like protein